jgi:hypothetical protein
VCFDKRSACWAGSFRSRALAGDETIDVIVATHEPSANIAP